MRFPAPIAVAVLALVATAACDVLNPNPRPSLFITLETEDPLVGDPVRVIISMTDASGLRDLVVDWGDETVETIDLEGTAQTFDPQHVYEADGRFEIGATVRDTNGRSASASVTVIVAPAPEP